MATIKPRAAEFRESTEQQPRLCRSYITQHTAKSCWLANSPGALGGFRQEDVTVNPRPLASNEPTLNAAYTPHTHTHTHTRTHINFKSSCSQQYRTRILTHRRVSQTQVEVKKKQLRNRGGLYRTLKISWVHSKRARHTNMRVKRIHRWCTTKILSYCVSMNYQIQCIDEVQTASRIFSSLLVSLRLLLLLLLLLLLPLFQSPMKWLQHTHTYLYKWIFGVGSWALWSWEKPLKFPSLAPPAANKFSAWCTLGIYLEDEEDRIKRRRKKEEGLRHRRQDHQPETGSQRSQGFRIRRSNFVLDFPSYKFCGLSLTADTESGAGLDYLIYFFICLLVSLMLLRDWELSVLILSTWYNIIANSRVKHGKNYL